MPKATRRSNFFGIFANLLTNYSTSAQSSDATGGSDDDDAEDNFDDCFDDSDDDAYMRLITAAEREVLLMRAKQSPQSPPMGNVESGPRSSKRAKGEPRGNEIAKELRGWPLGYLLHFLEENGYTCGWEQLMHMAFSATAKVHKGFPGSQSDIMDVPDYFSDSTVGEFLTSPPPWHRMIGTPWNPNILAMCINAGMNSIVMDFQKQLQFGIRFIEPHVPQDYSEAIEKLGISPLEELELCKCYFAIARALGPDITRILDFEAMVCPVYTFVGRQLVPTNWLALYADKSQMSYLLPGGNVQELFDLSDEEYAKLEVDGGCTSTGWKLYMKAYSVEIAGIRMDVHGSIRSMNHCGKQMLHMVKELEDKKIRCTGGVLTVDTNGPEQRRLMRAAVEVLTSGKNALSHDSAVAAVAEWMGARAVDTEGKARKAVVATNFTNAMTTSGVLGVILEDVDGKAVLVQLCNRIYTYAEPFTFDPAELKRLLESDDGFVALGGGLNHVLPGGASFDAPKYVRAVAFVLATVGAFWQESFEKFTCKQTKKGRASCGSLPEVKSELSAQIAAMGERESKWNLASWKEKGGQGAMLGRRGSNERMVKRAMVEKTTRHSKGQAKMTGGFKAAAKDMWLSVCVICDYVLVAQLQEVGSRVRVR